MNHSFPAALGRALAALLPLYAFAWRLIAVLTLARLAMIGWQWDRVAAAGTLLPVLIQGLRFDLVLLGLTTAIPVLLLPVLASNERLLPLWRVLLASYLPLMLLFVVFMELSTPSFMNQFDARPNILFVEYLDHPREVFATLWAAYKLPLVLASVVLVISAPVLLRSFQKKTAHVRATGALPVAVLFPIMLIACLGLARSTLDHRPVNPSTVALSNDPLVNDLALSSAYTLLYAIYETRHEDDGGIRYADMSDEDVIRIVRQSMHVPEDEFTSTELPTLHVQHGSRRAQRPRNLVIVIEESLGAEFVGALGGLPLTPSLDQLASQGIWFDNLYATGTRSVRGLEAIVSGYTPTPARSVVKLPKSQRDFFTLATLLSQQGYETSFIYGGESQFDNMRRFFINNGFRNIIDEKDYQDPQFVGSWGVSDEDLFLRAHEEFQRAGEKPFFSVVFSSSNHSPFQFPAGRIDLFDSEVATVNNAVKYADFALGRFFALARESNYWDDTIFLVVADHNSRVYGDEIIPIERFHIPGLILGGGVKAQRIATVASQIDLGPTLLSMIGIDAEHPMIGRDLTVAGNIEGPGRAIMQFNTTQAYMEGDQVIVMQRDRPIAEFRYENQRLVEDGQQDKALMRRAIAHSVWSSLAYQKSLFRLPKKDFSAS